MKIKLQQVSNKDDIEINISYVKMDNRLNQLIKVIRQYGYDIVGYKENHMYEIPLDEIFYFECIDGKTFFYTLEATYESPMNLMTLEKELKYTSVLRVQKNCLMNTKYLKSVSPYPNHRLLAELKNDEKLIISRKYIPELKNLGKRETV